MGRFQTTGAHLRYRWLTRPVVKKVINFARRLGADAGNFGEIRLGRTFDGFQCAEVLQERALARRSDAGDFLQPGFAHILLAASPVRSYGKAVRLVAQPLHEVEHRVAWLEHERLAPGGVEGLPPGVAVGSLGYGDKGYIGEGKGRKRLLRGGELATPAVDDHEIGPGGFGVIRNLLAPDILLACRSLHLSPKGRAQRVG